MFFSGNVLLHSKETTVLVSPWDGRHWTIKQHITCSSPNTVYVVMCEVHNEWYVGSTTDLKARWRNHKSDAKLKKATKCGVADHVTKFKHPADPQLGFLTIVAIEAVKEKRDLIEKKDFFNCQCCLLLKNKCLQFRLATFPQKGPRYSILSGLDRCCTCNSTSATDGAANRDNADVSYSSCYNRNNADVSFSSCLQQTEWPTDIMLTSVTRRVYNRRSGQQI